LRIFAKAFCLPNSFHVNGDQSGKGYSSMTYRPFTLEGNFAFASGINEMLIQSHTGVVKLFPAIPNDWEDVEFNNLRTEGAFLVSSELKDGKVIRVEVKSEQGGIFTLHNPFPDGNFQVEGADYDLEENRIIIDATAGKTIILQPKKL
jgi:alpha-L-fucosidase 2